MSQQFLKFLAWKISERTPRLFGTYQNFCYGLGGIDIGKSLKMPIFILSQLLCQTAIMPNDHFVKRLYAKRLYAKRPYAKRLYAKRGTIVPFSLIILFPYWLANIFMAIFNIFTYSYPLTIQKQHKTKWTN